MKSVVSISLLLAVAFFFVSGPAAAQPKLAKEPKLVAVDGQQTAPPALMSNIMDLRFGSQATGVESCLQVTITNNSHAALTVTKLFTTDEKHYTIPSPSKQMLPISIQPHQPLTLSVCFKPEKVGEFNSRLVLSAGTDSLVIPIEGKGIKPEDVKKLPKTEFTVIKPKKKGSPWSFKYQLMMQSKVTMQLFDELGVMKVTFLNGAMKNEGVYEMPFDGTDKGKQKLPVGKYYIRTQIEEVGRGNQMIKFTKEIEIK